MINQKNKIVSAGQIISMTRFFKMKIVATTASSKLTEIIPIIKTRCWIIIQCLRQEEYHFLTTEIILITGINFQQRSQSE